MPTFNRKGILRILLDWLLSGLFRREAVSWGRSINNPKEEFARAAKS